MIELRGHGDPLLVAAMQHMAIHNREMAEIEKSATICCEVASEDGRDSDPLFLATEEQTTMKRSSSMPSQHASDSENARVGSMGKTVDSWKSVDVSKFPGKVKPLPREPNKKQGDPLEVFLTKGLVDPDSEENRA